jgi:hypothetical protein
MESLAYRMRNLDVDVFMSQDDALMGELGSLFLKQSRTKPEEAFLRFRDALLEHDADPRADLFGRLKHIIEAIGPAHPGDCVSDEELAEMGVIAGDFGIPLLSAVIFATRFRPHSFFGILQRMGLPLDVVMAEAAFSDVVAAGTLLWIIEHGMNTDTVPLVFEAMHEHLDAWISVLDTRSIDIHTRLQVQRVVTRLFDRSRSLILLNVRMTNVILAFTYGKAGNEVLRWVTREGIVVCEQAQIVIALVMRHFEDMSVHSLEVMEATILMHGYPEMANLHDHAERLRASRLLSILLSKAELFVGTDRLYTTRDETIPADGHWFSELANTLTMALPASSSRLNPETGIPEFP